MSRGNRFENPHNRNLGYSERQFEKLLEEEEERRSLPKDPKERKLVKEAMRKLEEEKEKQVSPEAPTEGQIKLYNSLHRKCTKLHISIRLKRPYTKNDYSNAITYLKEVLKDKDGNTSTPTVKLYDKNKLLSLFDRMNNAQRTRLLAYAEGLLENMTDTKTERKNS